MPQNCLPEGAQEEAFAFSSHLPLTESYPMLLLRNCLCVHDEWDPTASQGTDLERPWAAT